MARSTRTGRKSRSSATSRTPELARSWPSAASIAAVVVVALLLAAEVARLTAAQAVAGEKPELASLLAPASPAALAGTAMAEIGNAAATGADPAAATLDKFASLASAAPLATDPYLVHAALAARAGETERAERLLLAARERNPRSAAARYLLADTWLRQGKVGDALGEMAILGRLVPGSSVQLVPALSEFARSPGAHRQLAPILASNPALKTPLLTALAADPANADLVLALAGKDSTTADPGSQVWKEKLLSSLVDAGEYDRAHNLWKRMSGGESRGQLLYNGRFDRLPAPPPFNWSYGSGAAGVAEPAGGRLRVLYYGRENTVLAAQLLLLPEGAYRFRAPVSGGLTSGALSWKLRCANDGRELMSLGASDVGTTLKVPSGCPAQQLELHGTMVDMPKVSDVQVGPVVVDAVK